MPDNRNRPASNGAASEKTSGGVEASLLPLGDWRDVATQLRAEQGWADVPPPIECPWCAAEPGVACRALMPSRRRRDRHRLRSTPGGCHPSRLEVAS